MVRPGVLRRVSLRGLAARRTIQTTSVQSPTAKTHFNQCGSAPGGTPWEVGAIRGAVVWATVATMRDKPIDIIKCVRLTSPAPADSTDSPIKRCRRIY